MGYRGAPGPARGPAPEGGQGTKLCDPARSASRSFSAPKCGRGKPALVRRHTLDDRSELLSCIENGNYAKAARIAAGELPSSVAAAPPGGLPEGSGSPPPGPPFWAICGSPPPPAPDRDSDSFDLQFVIFCVEYSVPLCRPPAPDVRLACHSQPSVGPWGAVAPPIPAPGGAPRTGWCWLVNGGQGRGPSLHKELWAVAWASSSLTASVLSAQRSVRTACGFPLTPRPLF